MIIYSSWGINTPSHNRHSHGGIKPSHAYNHRNHINSASNNSEKEHRDIGKALSSDPYCFIMKNVT